MEQKWRIARMLLGLSEDDGVLLDIRYASHDNLLGRPIYKRPVALLVPDAHRRLLSASAHAAALGLTLKIYDAFRPIEVQWIFWEALPDATFIADPRDGGLHPRGIAVDLTLVDTGSRQELDMGTGFDDMTTLSAHDTVEGLSPEAVRNRALLLGIMAASGWRHYDHEWWHYNLPNVQDYPPLSATDVPDGPL